MAELADAYIGQLFKKFGYFAPWLPNAGVKLGDVGILEKGVFKPRSKLDDLGIPYTATEAGVPAPYEFASENGVKIQFKISGTALPGSQLAEADAGASIQFTKRGAVVFESADVTQTRIADGEGVGRAVLAAFAKQAWQKEWVFVDEVYVGKRTTILVSKGSEAKIELRAKAAVVGKVPLSSDLEIASSDGMFFKTIGQGEMTVLFHLSRVKTKVLSSILGGRPSVGGVKRAMPGHGVPEAALAPGASIFEAPDFTPNLTLLDE